MERLPNLEHIHTGELNPTSVSYAEGIETYLRKTEEDRVLRPHQTEVFEDLHRFFQDGKTRGYINLPTGTGKTVLFVELSKALMEANDGEHKPKILVVTPTKDLVHQTLGKSGEKGFGRFAPDITIGSYFSDTLDEERNLDPYDVVVTTYRSFDILSRQNIYRPVTKEDREAKPNMMSGIKNVPSGRKALERFDVIILDEAHHALGEKARHTIANLPPEQVIIGFTATPDVDDNTQLTGVLPAKIHELGLNEAIYMGLLAPIAPIGVRSGVKVRGSDIYDENSEFIDSRLSYLAEDPNRNQQIMAVAKTLAEHGVGTIISCIAGGEAWHARYLAQQLNAKGVRSASVHNRVPAEQRQAIYHQFNIGEIDVLTFIGVLGEGWDSPRAKGLINARPTRSNIFSKQRLGRITRPGATAFAIDIYDDFESQNIPITVADVLNEGTVDYGNVIGTPEDTEKVQLVLESLRHVAADNLMANLQGVYREQAQYIAGLEKLYKGQLLDAQGKPEYATSTALNRNYHGITDEIIARYEELNGVTIPKKVAAQGKAARTVYAVKEGSSMLYDIPRVDPEKYHLDSNKEKWVAPEGIVQLFSKRYPKVDGNTISEILEIVGGSLEWIPGKYMTTPENATFRHHNVIKMYRVSNDMVGMLNNALAEYFSQDLNSHSNCDT